MLDGQFERTRIELSGGRGVTVTSWYDSGRQVWRASAPAYLHLLTDPDGHREDGFSGSTRDKAILAIRGLLVRRIDGV